MCAVKYSISKAGKTKVKIEDCNYTEALIRESVHSLFTRAYGPHKTRKTVCKHKSLCSYSSK